MSSDPKFIVQLAKTTNGDVLIKAWNDSDEVLGGSTAHLPMKPNKRLSYLEELQLQYMIRNYLKDISLYRLQTKKATK